MIIIEGFNEQLTILATCTKLLLNNSDSTTAVNNNILYTVKQKNVQLISFLQLKSPFSWLITSFNRAFSSSNHQLTAPLSKITSGWQRRNKVSASPVNIVESLLANELTVSFRTDDEYIDAHQDAIYHNNHWCLIQVFSDALNVWSDGKMVG